MQVSKRGITIREISDLLGISYEESYNLVRRYKFTKTKANRHITIDVDEFETWYTTQHEYKKVSELSDEEKSLLVAQQRKNKIQSMHPSLSIPSNKDAYSVKEAAVILDVTLTEIYALIKQNILSTYITGHKRWVLANSIQGWLAERLNTLTLEDAIDGFASSARE